MGKTYETGHFWTSCRLHFGLISGTLENMTSENTLDAHRPAEIAQMVESIGVTKAHAPLPQTLVLALLAGAFIGFGAAAFTAAMTGVDPTSGPDRLLGGIVFSLGLILVVVAGAELFTGNALMIMAAVDQKITLFRLLRSWLVVYVGNFVGAALLAVAFGLAAVLDGQMGTTAVAIAETKAQLEPMAAFFRGALCNALVCLAIWLTLAARTAVGKILAVLWPISAFVLLGLEHSIANMYFFPQGWLAGAEVSISCALSNLFWVTLGNIAGGAGGVALAYRFAFLSILRR